MKQEEFDRLARGANRRYADESGRITKIEILRDGKLVTITAPNHKPADETPQDKPKKGG